MGSEGPGPRDGDVKRVAFNRDISSHVLTVRIRRESAENVAEGCEVKDSVD